MATAPAKVSSQHLTIYLCKPSVKKAEDALQSDHGAADHGLPAGLTGTLYVRSSDPSPPNWVAFLKQGVPSLAPQGNVSNAAVLLLQEPKSKRWFAFTFGFGRFLLRLDRCESNFGLTVTINSVDPDKLRGIDVRTLEENSVHTRRQTTRNSPLELFGVDPARDVLRGVTGRPRSQAGLGSRLSGAMSLALALPITLDGLPKLCKDLLPILKSDYYKDRFGWIDEFVPVEPAECERLDLELVRRIQEPAPGVYLAPSEALDLGQVEGFVFSVAPDEPPNTDVELVDYLALRGNTALDVEALRAEELWAMSPNGDRSGTWSIYESLLCEIDRGAERFVLSAGAWYQVSAQFANLVDNYVKKVRPANHLPFPLYEHKDEAAYNAAARASLAQGAIEVALLDRKTVKWVGNNTSIEFCDLMTSAGDLIHIKRETAATHISHLLNQGLVGAECFVQEALCRAAVLQKVAELKPGVPKLLGHFKKQPDPRNYKVVYGVIAPGSNPLPEGLSFFSKVALMNVVRRLSALGYEVHMTRIGLTPDAIGKRVAAKVARKQATQPAPGKARRGSATGRAARSNRRQASAPSRPK